MSVFIINTFSAYLSIIFYLSIREGDLCHSAVVAGDLERRHKGDPSLRDRHYETVITRPSLRSRRQLCPPPGRSTGSPSLSGGTRRGCSPGAAATTEIRLSANCFKTGSWEDRTRVCTVLASSCLGRGWRVLGCSVGAMDWHRAGTPPAAHTVAGHRVPPHHQAAPMTPTQLCMLGREVWGRLSWSSAFFSAVRPISGGKLHPARPQQPLVPPSQALSTQSLR